MRIHRKYCLSLLSLAGFVGLFGYGASASMEFRTETARRPHIVLIVADDMGWDDVSFRGVDQIPIPNIDALAYNGVILNRHYVLSICAPSRTSLMTGRYAIREGMQGLPLQAGELRGISLNVTLLPQHMRRLGCETRFVGKWHFGYETEDHTPVRRGFDSFFGYYNELITYFKRMIA